MIYEIKTYAVICDQCNLKLIVSSYEHKSPLPEGWVVRSSEVGWVVRSSEVLCETCSVKGEKEGILCAKLQEQN